MEKSSWFLLQEQQCHVITQTFTYYSTSFQNQKGALATLVSHKKSKLELTMEKFILSQSQENKEFMN